jgi:hypothetical protein
MNSVSVLDRRGVTWITQSLFIAMECIEHEMHSSKAARVSLPGSYLTVDNYVFSKCDKL